MVNGSFEKIIGRWIDNQKAFRPIFQLYFRLIGPFFFLISRLAHIQQLNDRQVFSLQFVQQIHFQPIRKQLAVGTTLPASCLSVAVVTPWGRAAMGRDRRYHFLLQRSYYLKCPSHTHLCKHTDFHRAFKRSWHLQQSSSKCRTDFQRGNSI